MPKKDKKQPKKEYQRVEGGVLDLLAKGTELLIDGKRYVIRESDKPSARGGGEPKTDVYALAMSDDGNARELKISVKADNADFFENKVSASRAEEFLGDEWRSKLEAVTPQLAETVAQRKLIDADKHTVTLGYRLDIMNKKSGTASVPFVTDYDTKLEIITGANASEDKRDAIVGGRQVKDSGVANLVFHADKGLPDDATDLIASCVTAEQEARDMPDMYAAAKAVNLRLDGSGRTRGKEHDDPRDLWAFDTNRPLLIPIHYTVEKDRAKAEVTTNEALQYGARDTYNEARAALEEIGVVYSSDLVDDYTVNIASTGGGDDSHQVRDQKPQESQSLAPKAPGAMASGTGAKSGGATKKQAKPKRRRTRREKAPEGGFEELIEVDGYWRNGHYVKGYTRRKRIRHA